MRYLLSVIHEFSRGGVRKSSRSCSLVRCTTLVPHPATGSSGCLWLHNENASRRASTTTSLTNKGAKRPCAGTTASSFPRDSIVVLWTTILPAPKASAAGVRTLGILQQFLLSKGISSIHVVSPNPSQREQGSLESRAATETVEQLQRQGVQFHIVPANREDAARTFLQGFAHHPGRLLCVFDRFYTEEMYSHFVHRYAPDATLVLDMQDMHSLRRKRQHAVQTIADQGDSLESGLRAAQDALPCAQDTDLLRELASIHRTDLTLVCSSYEKTLLQEHYGLLQHKLVTAPLLGNVRATSCQSTLSWDERKDVCFVGGFRHEPNVDAVDQLMRLWPRIRQQVQEEKFSQQSDLPCLKIYGAYLTPALRQRWHAKLKQYASTKFQTLDDVGVSLVGFTPNLEDALHRHRLLVAPLRYGAGLKGKLVEAWKAGLPVVTTPMGSEGLFFDSLSRPQFFPGRVVDTDQAFIQSVVDLYVSEQAWDQAVKHTQLKGTNGTEEEPFGDSNRPETTGDHWQIRVDNNTSWACVSKRLIETMATLSVRRQSDTVQAILWREGTRSTEYFSKYIEQKERRE